MTNPPPTALASLESFEVLERLGEGAMGTVWRARHRQSGQPVAIKVVKGAEGQSRRQARPGLILREARSMAAMAHPNIVRILDFGHLDGADAASDYIVMELAEDGCLDPAAITDWPALLECLLQVLDGLAHAHSRDRVHLDLKPSNILVDKRPEGRPRYMIADFGIAHQIGSVRGPDRISGTPAYMAPEQVLGRAYMLGPWTDLYALGCLAWQLLTGAPPFLGGHFVALANAHVHQPLPPFAPTLAVPDGIADWLDRLLAKEPADRFPNAAAAAYMLSQLDGPAAPSTTDGGATPSTTDEHAAEAETIAQYLGDQHPGDQHPGDQPTTEQLQLTATASPTEMMATLAAVTVAPQMAIEAFGRSRRDDRAQDIPPFPDNWRRTSPPTPLELGDAGAGLFDLRPSPFVGRAAEFDWLWDHFGEVIRESRPAHLTVSGAPGVGKTRLVDAFCRRLRELGQARILRLDLGGGPWALAFSRTLAGFLRVSSASDPAFASQARMRIPGADLDRLTRLVDLPEGAFDRRASHLAAAGEVVARLAGRRPVVLVCDHVSADTSGLDFAQLFAQRHPEAPALLVSVAGNDEALPIVAERVRTEGEDHLEVDALTPPQAAAFVERTLALADDEVDRLLEAAGYDPAFARQIIARWLETDQLSAHPDGYRGGELPASQRALWLERLRDIAERVGTKEKAALEGLQAAAVLGASAEKTLWGEVLQRVGVPRPEALLEELTRKGFVRDEDESVVFEEGTFHRALLTALDETERAEAYHLAAAEVLQERGGRLDKVRAAQCLARAGRLPDALSLLKAEAFYTTTVDSLALFQWAESLYEAHPQPELTEERLMTKVNQALTHLDNADFTAADLYIEQLEDALDADSPVRLMVERDRLLATRALYKNEPFAGLAPARAALELSLEHCSEVEVCLSHGTLGDLLFYARRFEDARTHYEEARSLAESITPFQKAWADYALGTLAVHTGEFALADEYLAAALSHFRETDFPFGTMYVRHSLGLLANRRGDHATAERHFGAALDDARIGDHRFGVNLHEHLGRLYARTGRADEALDHLARVRAEAARTGFDYMVWYFYDAELEALAHLGRWEDCNHVLQEARQTSAKPGLYADTIAQTFEHAAQLARSAGRAAVAQAAGDRAERVRRQPFASQAN